MGGSDLRVVDGISKSFSGLRAVTRASLPVPEGGIVSLIGPNGAGQSTCFNMIACVFRPYACSISFAGHRIDGLRPRHLCNAGIIPTFHTLKPPKPRTPLHDTSLRLL